MPGCGRRSQDAVQIRVVSMIDSREGDHRAIPAHAVATGARQGIRGRGRNDERRGGGRSEGQSVRRTASTGRGPVVEPAGHRCRRKPDGDGSGLRYGPPDAVCPRHGGGQLGVRMTGGDTPASPTSATGTGNVRQRIACRSHSSSFHRPAGFGKVCSCFAPVPSGTGPRQC